MIQDKPDGTIMPQRFFFDKNFLTLQSNQLIKWDESINLLNEKVLSTLLHFEIY